MDFVYEGLGGVMDYNEVSFFQDRGSRRGQHSAGLESEEEI